MTACGAEWKGERSVSERLLAIDGMSLLNRAFHALPPLTAPDGTPTGAIHGFFLTFMKWYDAYEPTHVAIAFDRPGGTFRHQQFERYKAHRKEADPALLRQFPLAEELLTEMGLKVIGIPGFEADDVLGTISERFASLLPVTVISGDRDLLQLVGGRCEIVLMRSLDGTKRYDEDLVMQDFGVTPAQVPDWKGLMGDQSDGIPGVPGIGEKTAVRLLQIAPTLEQLLEDTSRVTPQRIRDLLETHREQALFSKRLATIVRDVPLGRELDELRWAPGDVSMAVRRRLAELGLRNLAARLPAGGDAAQPGSAVPEPAARPLQEVLGGGEQLALAFAGDAVALSDQEGAARVLAWDDANLRQALAAGSALAVHGAKHLWHELASRGIRPPSSWYDTQLAAYLVNPQFGVQGPSEVLQGLYGVAPAEGESAGVAAEATWQLARRLPASLAEQRVAALYSDVEAPLLEVLARMEQHGVQVDRAELECYGGELREALAAIGREVEELAGYSFNLNSTLQLRELLFGKLQLPVLKRTKTGPSTDAEVLEQLAEQHAIVQKILDHRQVQKLLSTYVEGLLPLIAPDGRVRTTFQQTLTATGRLSSETPNLQNIPVRFELGRRLRRAFVPTQAGLRFLAADYSQIELRILAHLSGDPAMRDAFLSGDDIHRRTAAEVFSVPLEAVTADQRRQAKAVNFGIVYGISDFGLARDTGSSRAEAAEFIRRYFSRYPRVKEYLDAVVAAARDKGYVTTMFGRRRYLPEIRSRNHQQRSFAERTAMNTPIQGTAADLIKRAMVQLDEELDPTGPAALLLQVHDELILEGPAEDIAELGRLVRRAMAGAADLSVPLVVDLKTGPNWYDLEPVRDA
jgi:DNA polymerase-1